MKISILVVVALFACNEARPQVPDQVAEFLKQTFFNPILEKVDEGGELASHVISQIANITQVHAENDKAHDGDEKTPEIISPIAEILAKIQDKEDETSTDPTPGPTDSSLDVEVTTQIPEEKPAKNKTQKVNYLDTENIAKL